LALNNFSIFFQRIELRSFTHNIIVVEGSCVHDTYLFSLSVITESQSVFFRIWNEMEFLTEPEIILEKHGV